MRVSSVAMAHSAPIWDRPRILTMLVATAAGQLLLIYPGERLLGAALLGLNAVYFTLFFRNVRAARRLEQLLQESGDLPEDFDEQDDSRPIGGTYPWIFLIFPVLYLGAALDANLDAVVSVAVWVDLARLAIQFLMIAVVHADLRHKLKMLTDPAYLQRVLDAARAEKERGES